MALKLEGDLDILKIYPHAENGVARLRQIKVYILDDISMAITRTRGQSNLAKAASNAPHTPHALDSITIAVPKVCRGSQKLKVGHVTQTRIRI